MNLSLKTNKKHLSVFFLPSTNTLMVNSQCWVKISPMTRHVWKKRVSDPGIFDGSGYRLDPVLI